ncbi:MAG: N-6 DNA methylase [Acidobacteriia bacterium]|nr:N-6 DNA methylase [Terriglobia bacterium]
MRRQPFTTIRTEGGLFPPDFLQRLTEGSSKVPGMTPEAYHLAGKEKLHEAASRAWNRLLGIWTVFYATNITAGDPGTTTTREKWLLPLFGELGYGRLQQARAVEVNGRSYPVSHVWQNVPIHLVGRNIDLDHRTAGVAGAARTSPHSLVQELLNRREESHWGFVSNGLKLRLLRDNRSLTRQAYVEFDLIAMMEGQAFSDFVILWLMCHQSRVEAALPEPCWLEKWATEAREQGTRALDELRDGVEHAIEALGRGFLKHAANKPLLEKLRVGTLDRQDYYRQLLRVVYRLIFLFVAESRELLLVAEPGSPAAERYGRFYSIARLRALAASRRGTPHGDLWESLLVVIRGLSSNQGLPKLGLPALGSLLWSNTASPDLDSCQLANGDLLEAIRALAFRFESDVRRNVDWQNLGPEELGSVYESLLELHPDVNLEAASFSLRVAAGHERKTTGSYYTPTSLVDCLLDSALDPVLEQAAKAADPERAILHLKVCDPACGSGHFLIAAAHRIARRLAAVRTGDAEPSPDAVRHALRDVIGHCVYGVDVNEMAVELCKVNLWLEALDPGKPLSFLDQRIQCGNSLLGAAPALLRGGIPEAAFSPIEGDDPEQCRFLKRSNRREREGFQSLVNAEAWERVGDLAKGMAALEEIDDSTLDGVHQMETRYADLVRSASYECGRLWADSWCAAFVWPKTKDAQPLTEDMFRIIERNPMAAPEPLRNDIRRIVKQYGFFHWHLAFPEVFHVARADEPLHEGPGWTGGFDVVLGNPPWERIKIQEKEWFSERRPDIADAPNAAARKRIIQRLKDEDPALWTAWCEALRQSDGEAALVRSSGRYPLCGRGDINTYAIFAELNRTLLNPHGRAGFIVPTGIATDDTTKFFFQDLVERNSLISLYDFQSGPGLFSAIGHARFKFALVTLAAKQDKTRPIEFAFFLRSLPELQEHGRRFTLTANDIALLNPNTFTCPIFRNERDAEVTKRIYQSIPVLMHEVKGEPGNPWKVSFLRMLDMATDSSLFRTAAQLESGGWAFKGNVFENEADRYVPLYEAKMVHQYTHRFGDYADKEVDDEGLSLPEVPVDRLVDPDYVVQPRYWVPENAVDDRLRDRWSSNWLLGWRDICRSTDERTVISSVIPRVGVGDKFLLMLPEREQDGIVLCATLDSFVLDYAARQKLGGTSLKYFTMRQLPILSPNVIDSPAPWQRATLVRDWITPRVLELNYTAWDLQAFAADMKWNRPPFRWDAARRFLLRCELDAAFFHLYGIGANDVNYIMDTFHIVRRDDEVKHGEYRTKQVILDIHDRMRRAIDTNQPYQTVLNPPPADPRIAHSVKPFHIAAISPNAWSTPQGVTSESVALFSLVDVLRQVGRPVASQQIRIACILVRHPALALAFMTDEEARAWLRAIGSEAKPVPTNVIQISYFQDQHIDQPWADAVSQLTATGGMISQSGMWSAGRQLPSSSGQEWILRRAAVVVELLNKIDLGEAEPKLITFVRSIHDGTARRFIS